MPDHTEYRVLVEWVKVEERRVTATAWEAVAHG
jgi:hypothetical protein